MRTVVEAGNSFASQQRASFFFFCTLARLQSVQLLAKPGCIEGVLLDTMRHGGTWDDRMETRGPMVRMMGEAPQISTFGGWQTSACIYGTQALFWHGFRSVVREEGKKTMTPVGFFLWCRGVRPNRMPPASRQTHGRAQARRVLGCYGKFIARKVEPTVHCEAQ